MILKNEQKQSFQTNTISNKKKDHDSTLEHEKQSYHLNELPSAEENTHSIEDESILSDVEASTFKELEDQYFAMLVESSSFYEGSSSPFEESSSFYEESSSPFEESSSLTKSLLAHLKNLLLFTKSLLAHLRNLLLFTKNLLANLRNLLLLRGVF